MNPTDIRDRALLVSLSISQFSPRKVDQAATNETLSRNQADTSAGKFNKSILPKDALKPIQTIANDARTWFYKQTLPWSDEGKRILPSAQYLTFCNEVRTFKSKFNAAVEAFLKDYAAHQHKAQSILGGLYNPDDYPDAREIREKYSMELSTETLPSTTDFRVELSETERKAIIGEIESRVSAATFEAHRDLFRRLMEPVRHMAERLKATDPETGKPAIFRDSLVENIREIVAIAPSLNLQGDKQLAAFIEEIRLELSLYSADTLRQSPTTRDTVAQEAQSILDRMSALAIA